MSLLVKLAFRNLKVKKEYVIQLIEGLDTDKDGYVSLREMAEAVRTWGKKLKRAIKYVGKD